MRRRKWALISTAAVLVLGLAGVQLWRTLQWRHAPALIHNYMVASDKSSTLQIQVDGGACTTFSKPRVTETATTIVVGITRNTRNRCWNLYSQVRMIPIGLREPIGQRTVLSTEGEIVQASSATRP